MTEMMDCLSIANNIKKNIAHELKILKDKSVTMAGIAL